MPLIATKGAASAQGFGEFAQTTAPVYIEDVFSTYLYTGNSSTNTITNGIDLSTKGGLVWCKSRASAYDHALYDTARGINKELYSNTTAAQYTGTGTLTAFNSNGFTLGANGSANSDSSVSWTFREQPKFFDIVTYTGNGSNRTISHNLGSVPGCIIVKRTDGVTGWPVYHRSIGASQALELQITNAAFASSSYWNDTAPTSTVFSLGTDNYVNANGATYVAYIFAHDAGGFGLTGSDNVISCGSFTTDANGEATVTLDWEPQWVLLKGASTSYTTNWNILDSMRGMPVSGNQNQLRPNTADAEISAANASAFPNATGFKAYAVGGATLSGHTYIYIAIRRGPMETPTAGTAVFQPTVRTGTGATASISGLAFPPDLVITRNRPSNLNDKSVVFDKLRGVTKYLITSGTDAEATGATTLTSFNQTGESFGDAGLVNGNGDSYINWQFLRAPGFFDEVCYTGNGPGTQTINHNLGVVPELVINKTRSSINGWTVFQGSTTSLTGFLRLNTNNAQGGDTLTVSSTSITADSTIGLGMNTNGTTYVTYLFASCPGVSKIGTYTGTGALQTVNCGFTTGARFVLIKRTDSTGDWWVYDSARGISSGNDPYLLLNSTAAEVTGTNYVDTTSVGFQVTAAAPAGLNANGGTYIFLAIA